MVSYTRTEIFHDDGQVVMSLTVLNYELISHAEHFPFDSENICSKMIFHVVVFSPAEVFLLHLVALDLSSWVMTTHAIFG